MSDEPLHPEFDEELLSAYLDNELASEERALVEARLAQDPAARNTLAELRHVSQAVRGLPGESVRHDLREAILHRVGKAKQGNSAESADTDATSLPTISIGRTRRGWFWAAMAVAAALLITITQRDVAVNNDANGPSVAMRRDEPAAMRAMPTDESPPASPAPASGLAVSDSFGSRRTTNDSILGAPAPTAAEGKIAATRRAAPHSEFASEVEDDSLVVVHVVAKRSALQNKAFDQVLVSNGIAVNPDPQSTETDSPDDTSGVAGIAGRFSGIGSAPRAVEGAEVDVILVEAPPTQIASFMSDLNQDSANFVSVAVDERPAAEKLGTLITPLNKKFALDLNKYNRGVVPQQQKELFANDKQFYYQQLPDQSRMRALGGARSSSANESSQKRYSAQAEAERGRAQRLLAPNLENRQLSEPQRRGEAAEGRSTPEIDNLQVLFVLSPADDSPTSPAAENPRQ